MLGEENNEKMIYTENPSEQGLSSKDIEQGIPGGVNLLKFKCGFEDPLFEKTAEDYILNSVEEGLNVIKVWSAVRANKPYPESYAKGLDVQHVQQINTEAHQILGMCLAMGTMLHTYDRNRKAYTIPAEPIRSARGQLKIGINSLMFPRGEVKYGPDFAVEIKTPEDLELLLADNLIMVNHDIRGKLQTIMGYAQLIARRPGAASVDIINNTIRELGNFIDELLKYKKEEITVQDIENACWQKLVVTLSPHQIDLRRRLKFEVAGFDELKSKSLSFNWSGILLNETLENIANNLFKSFRAKELDEEKEGEVAEGREEVNLVRVEVGLFKNDKGKEYFKICIEGNGRGYPEEVIKHGFEEAYKRGKTGWGHSSIPTEGSGMRKYCVMLEKNFDGKIIPENTPNGSRTTILLPLS